MSTKINTNNSILHKIKAFTEGFSSAHRMKMGIIQSFKFAIKAATYAPNKMSDPTTNTSAKETMEGLTTAQKKNPVEFSEKTLNEARENPKKGDHIKEEMTSSKLVSPKHFLVLLSRKIESILLDNNLSEDDRKSLEKIQHEIKNHFLENTINVRNVRDWIKKITPSISQQSQLINEFNHLKEKLISGGLTTENFTILNASEDQRKFETNFAENMVACPPQILLDNFDLLSQYIAKRLETISDKDLQNFFEGRGTKLKDRFHFKQNGIDPIPFTDFDFSDRTNNRKMLIDFLNKKAQSKDFVFKALLIRDLLITDGPKHLKKIRSNIESRHISSYYGLLVPSKAKKYVHKDFNSTPIEYFNQARTTLRKKSFWTTPKIKIASISPAKRESSGLLAFKKSNLDNQDTPKSRQPADYTYINKDKLFSENNRLTRTIKNALENEQPISTYVGSGSTNLLMSGALDAKLSGVALDLNAVALLCMVAYTYDGGHSSNEVLTTVKSLQKMYYQDFDIDMNILPEQPYLDNAPNLKKFLESFGDETIKIAMNDAWDSMISDSFQNRLQTPNSDNGDGQVNLKDVSITNQKNQDPIGFLDQADLPPF